MTLTVELNNGSIRKFEHALFDFSHKHPDGTIDVINSSIIIKTSAGDTITFPSGSWSSFNFSI